MKLSAITEEEPRQKDFLGYPRTKMKKYSFKDMIDWGNKKGTNGVLQRKVY